MFAMDQPKDFEKLLHEKYNFKLKKTGEIDYHIDMNFFHDKDGTLCIKPAKYIAKMIDTYTRMFGAPPSTKVHLHAEANNHPKLDNLELLGAEGVQQYQSLIGMLQWIS